MSCAGQPEETSCEAMFDLFPVELLLSHLGPESALQISVTSSEGLLPLASKALADDVAAASHSSVNSSDDLLPVAGGGVAEIAAAGGHTSHQRALAVGLVLHFETAAPSSHPSSRQPGQPDEPSSSHSRKAQHSLVFGEFSIAIWAEGGGGGGGGGGMGRGMGRGNCILFSSIGLLACVKPICQFAGGKFQKHHNSMPFLSF